jgi:protease-4
MSSHADPGQSTQPILQPIIYAAPPPRRSIVGRFFDVIYKCFVFVSMAFSFLFFIFLARILLQGGFTDDQGLRERYYSGQKTAHDKIAIVRIEGVILEGMTGYAIKQIQRAAQDEAVRAVVVRINSPGGSITASDDLYRRLEELRDGNAAKKTAARPLVVSMASLAASGGYYVAMPAKQVFAERTTLTGSIGVYAAFPNVAELATKYGVKMLVIKAGEVKDSGSMFHDMTSQERQLWQDMVDHAYDQFLKVVEDGRGNKLKYPLRAAIPEEARKIPERDKDGNLIGESSAKNARLVSYVRRLADGGIFTADKALKYGLVDQVGYLDDAVATARNLAGLSEDYQAVTYERQEPLLQSLLVGQKDIPTETHLDLTHLGQGLMPRLWYLAPQCDIAGILSAAR